MRRLAQLLAVMGALSVGCTGSHVTATTGSTPSVSTGPALATGRVSLAIVAYCGAGGRPCPLALLRRMNRDYRQHDGYLIATPTTVLVGGFGCGGSFPAPVGSGFVTKTELRWRVNWTRSASLDCDGQVVAFARFARAVFDMRTPILVRSDDRTRRRVLHTRAWPAPNLAQWANGQGMTAF